MNKFYRPWGSLNNIIPDFSITNWDFFGCLATEDRCLSVFQSLYMSQRLNQKLFLEIIDPVDTDVHKYYRDQNRLELQPYGNYNHEVHKLLEPLHIIHTSVQKFLEYSSGNIILDITCLPKRFFFPIIKFIFLQKKVKNFLVTYSKPLRYSKDELAENPLSWQHILPFKSESEDGTEAAIIGVGFLPLGLPDVLTGERKSNKKIKMLFPFPPGPPDYQRIWHFVKKINEFRPIQPQELIRINAMNVSEAFDEIRSISEMGRKKVLFAPFGPKTFSLAMALHACQSDSSVYYTQPKEYHPNYSVGCSETYAYCIQIEGKNIFDLTAN